MGVNFEFYLAVNKLIIDKTQNIIYLIDRYHSFMKNAFKN